MRRWDWIILGFLVLTVCLTHLVWVHRNNAPLANFDGYLYLLKLNAFIEGLHQDKPLTFASSLKKLSLGGRPPLYQLLTIPLLVFMDLTEDTALSLNLIFIAILLIATFNIGHLIRGPTAGLLSALLVISYPPVLHLSRNYLPHFAATALGALSLWLIYSLLLKNKRSIKLAWLLGLSLGVGLLTHPYFGYVLAVPTLLAGLHLFLFQTCSKYSLSSGQVSIWVAEKLYDRFIAYGLIPAALVAVVPPLLWYSAAGGALLDLFNTVLLADHASYGFLEIEPSFLWRARTAAGALSNILAIFLLIGFTKSISKPMKHEWILAVTLFSAYVVFSLMRVYAWFNFAIALPVAAVLTASWIAGVKHNWLRTALLAIASGVAAFNFLFVTWGSHSWAQSIAITLGSPLLDSRTCTDRRVAAFCPDIPWRRPWPSEAIRRILLEDPLCQRDRPCQVVFIKGTLDLVFRFHLAKEGDRQLRKENEKITVRRVDPNPHIALCKSDYLFFSDFDVIFPGSTMNERATHAFLKAPPASFHETHQMVATFTLPSEKVGRLLKRTRIMTEEEAATCIAKFELFKKTSRSKK